MVEGLAIGKYYWQVNSYIYGDPATTSYETNPGDPNIIRGLVWNFDAVSDAPPSSADAGVDMITWAGEPVQLDGTVVDDAQSALTIAWSSDDPAGTDVSFSATDIEDPAVTITKVGYTAAGIINPSFEEFLIGWDIYVDDGWCGVWDGTFNKKTYITPSDGDWCIWLHGNHGDGVIGSWISQTLVETLAAETTYTLEVDVINDGYYNEDVHYKVQLLAGETVVAEDDDSLPLDPVPPGTSSNWETSTVTFAVGGESDPNFVYVGEPLGIRLVAKAGVGEMSFDKVQLTANPEFPAPEHATVELILRAGDVANPMYVLKDSMTVDVYSDACAAAIGIGKSADNPGDLDEDCDTDLEDLVAAVETWLNDTGLVKAAVIPAGSVSALDNSGFEVPDQGDNGYTNPYPPTGVDGWTFTGGSGLSGPDGPWRCQSDSPDPLGDQFAYLQGTAAISQEMTGLMISGTYELSFFESYRTAYESGNDLIVILDEGLPSEKTIYYNPGVTNTTWEARTTDIFYASKTSYTLTFRTTNPLGGDRSTIIDGVVVNKSTYLTDPFPANGATVSAGDVELSWTNLPANDPNDPDLVWVDVWFGTDPNDLMGVDYKKVVDAGENVTSVTVSAPVIGGTYYWQVDSYLDGSGTSDPNEGPVWVFYASDLPPYVNVDDVITWSGQEVQLAPTVEDDELSGSLSYSWSAEPSDGVEFSATDIEAPTVTITKATGDAATFTLTLEVDDSVNPPVEDTMTIEVYDNNCLAAKAAGLAEIDATDFDADCDTDIEDYAEIAEDWLVDYELTEPVEKP
jgi:hypothetical protein